MSEDIMLPEESKENNDDAEVRRIRGIECEKEFKKHEN